MSNTTIELMLRRKSIRKYTNEMPTDEVIETVVRAGQQAPFASQLYSILLKRSGKRPFGAPLLFTLCVDCYKLKRFMAQRGWQVVTNDVSLLLFGIQDTALLAENMVIAGESLGLGSCFLGGAAYRATQIAQEYKLPPRVFPLVQLAMGYPAHNPPPRPRYPLAFTLFEDEYPHFSDEEVREAMAVMDKGYLAQDYYQAAGLIPLEDQREETFTLETYSWTEHISRKWGQWYPSSAEILEQLALCGFHVCLQDDEDE
jgi:nitroreductase